MMAIRPTPPKRGGRRRPPTCVDDGFAALLTRAAAQADALGARPPTTSGRQQNAGDRRGLRTGRCAVAGPSAAFRAPGLLLATVQPGSGPRARLQGRARSRPDPGALVPRSPAAANASVPQRPWSTGPSRRQRPVSPSKPRRRLSTPSCRRCSPKHLASAPRPPAQSVTASPLWDWSGDALAKIVGAASRYKRPARLRHGLDVGASVLADDAENNTSLPWSRQSEQQLRLWLRAQQIQPSHARHVLAPALHALKFPEHHWVATLDDMGVNGVHALIHSVQEQQEQDANEEKVTAEADVQVELQIEMPTDPVKLKALQMQIRIDMARALGVDVSQVGEVELESAPD